NPLNVNKIGGKTPIGSAINLEIQMRTYQGEVRPEIASIFAVSDSTGSPKKAKETALPTREVEEDEDLPDFDDAVEDSEDAQEREAELLGMKIADLRSIAEGDYDLNIKGVKKAGLVEMILEHEFSDEESMALSDEDPEEDE